MADIINLRQARKAKVRAEAAAAADRNRIRFGRPKADRTLDAARIELDRKRLDAHRLEDGGKKPDHE